MLRLEIRSLSIFFMPHQIFTFSDFLNRETLKITRKKNRSGGGEEWRKPMNKKQRPGTKPAGQLECTYSPVHNHVNAPRLYQYQF
jgi:hypothetical protein